MKKPLLGSAPVDSGFGGIMGNPDIEVIKGSLEAGYLASKKAPIKPQSFIH